jgi:hypothetical protein
MSPKRVLKAMSKDGSCQVEEEESIGILTQSHHPGRRNLRR